MNTSPRNQVIALAGLMQATLMVHQIASRGRADPVDMQTCIESTLKIDAVDVDDVYGGISRLESGLLAFMGLLDESPEVTRQLMRYAGLIIFHERNLMQDDDKRVKVRAGVERAALLSERLGSLHDDVIATLAETYQYTISKFEPKIIVTGNPNHLSDTDNGKRIRALLLAAIRSSVLWRQCGGNRFNLLLSRFSRLHIAKGLLSDIQH